MLWITLLCFAASLLHARENYRVEMVPTPPTIHQTQQIDALCFTPGGKLAVCLPVGEIWLMEPESRIWTLFAEGLHNPLGMLAVRDHDFIVTQRPELTRVVDEDGDGRADRYECLSDQFGLSGNYHEFNFTPVADARGDIFFALGTGSNGDGIRQIVRGKYKQNGRPGRMHASVPYRGWIMKHDMGTGETIPWASGLRTPNGIGFDLEGNLFATDNQGDWVGACKLFHIQKNEFYGHAASFNWRPDAEEPALLMGAKKLDSYRTRAAVVFPYGSMSNSPSQPLVDDQDGGFGPFHGQLFVGEMNQSRILRIMLEEVDGQLQGACIPFLEGIELPKGANRLAFGPDSSLYVGHTKHTWPGEKGISRIIWDGKPPMDVLTMNLTRKGFRLTFTKPLNVEVASNKDAYQFERYFYGYHEAYGSQQYDKRKVAVKSVHVSDDRRTVEIELEELACYYIHDLQMIGLSADDGSPLANSNVAYTVNRLLENSPPEPRQYDYEEITVETVPEKEEKGGQDSNALIPN
ncbi:DUF7133 domain-containing protein [Haloferula sp.]|uniref:DUF7133 domain-containing protein n=1 Tax=Haloferula sp. TaxID=2497595 RepID=UPI003C76F935